MFKKLIAGLTDLYRPYHRPSWPEQLWPEEEIEAGQFHAEGMLRHGSLSHAMNMEFGVFQLIGQKYARRATYSWRPRERLLMEEVSLAFHLLDGLRQRGEKIPANDKERLAISLLNYFRFLGENRTRDEVKQLIENYLAQNSLPEGDGITPSTPIRVYHPGLEKLQRLDAELNRAANSHLQTLDGVDLRLDEQLDDSRYDFCTPLNVRTFANTGGDGHHFSFLVIDGAITEASPVVLTQPDYCGESVIVGETLQEFLSLGCRGGYGDVTLQHPLAAATFEPYKMIDEDTFATNLEASQTNLLRALSKEFALRPWTDPNRFQQLQDKYRLLLRLPPDVAELHDR